MHDARWRVSRPASVYAAASTGALVHHAKDSPVSWPLTLVELGPLTLDTGALAVCDPYIMDEDPPAFSDTMAAGPPELALGVADVGPDHQRNAFALLLGTGSPIVRWQLALLPDQSEADMPDDDGYLGFPVDSGTACLASPSTARAAGAVLAADCGMLRDPLSMGVDSSTHNAVLAAPAPGAEPVAVVQCGWGDGWYPTWFGFDAADNVSVALVDFLLNDDPE
ncbi:MAG: DUF4241 domain-containing protein [Acidimicrobiales bacterium]